MATYDCARCNRYLGSHGYKRRWWKLRLANVCADCAAKIDGGASE